MNWALGAFALILSSLLSLQTRVASPQEEKGWLREIFSKNEPSPVAGMPYKEALEILKHHEQELLNLPGVDAIDMDKDGILVYTDNPSVVPSTVEGLPVRTTTSLERAAPLTTQPQELEPAPPEANCGPDAHWDPQFKRCRRNASPANSLIPSVPRPPLPPPSGVIVLRSDGGREKADACPQGFKEATEHGWRFCLPPGYTGSLPPLWEPPIAGIPYEEAQAILKRHQTELMQLPGVSGVGLRAEGIVVRTDNPTLVPSAVEGLPIITRPPIRFRVNTHSENTRIRPLRGAAAIRDQLWPSIGTLTGIRRKKLIED